MDADLEKYLSTIDKYLRPLPTSERVDIVKEIKASVLEMKNEHIPTERILERLGEPKDLTIAYLGDLISTGAGFSLNRILTMIAFYSVVGFSGLFVIPTLVIVAPTFIVCAVFMPMIGAVKLADHLAGMNLPYIQDIGIVLPSVIKLNSFVEFFLSILIGVILYILGHGSWKLLLYYVKKISRTKRRLSI